MQNTENKEVLPNEGDTEKKDLGLKEDDPQKVRELVRSEVLQEHELNEKEQAIYEKILEEATMPVIMNNSDFKLGDSELDIRRLNNPNYKQMMFRQGVLNAVYLKQLLSTAVDITRLLMIIADKLGIENIIKATDDIIEKAAKENEEIQKLKEMKENQDKKDA